MPEKHNVFGAELPPEAIKAKQLHPERGHEAARDAMVEGLVQRTRALVPLIQFTETVTDKNTTAEIIDGLERMQKQVLASVSVEKRKQIPSIVKQWKRAQTLKTQIDARYPDKPDDWVLFSDKEFDELSALDARMLDTIDDKEDLLILVTLLFVEGLKQRRQEVEQMRDESMALQHLNLVLKKKGYGQLQQSDISEVHFRPFDVGFSVSTNKLKALLSRDIGGVYFSPSPFFLVQAKGEHDDAIDFLFHRPKDATVRHESTHASLDTLESRHFYTPLLATPELISHAVSFDWHDPSLVFEARFHGYQRLVEKRVRATSEEERRQLSEKMDKSKHVLFDPTRYLDASRNEFLAELSALYRAPADPLSWATADKQRNHFIALLKEKASADPDLPFDTLRESFEKRSEVARKSLVMALRAARHLGADAQAFVASATLLLQPSQYHHLEAMLTREYGKERLDDVRLADEVSTRTTKSFDELDQVIRDHVEPLSPERQTMVSKAARIADEIDFMIFAAWNISSSRSLLAVIARMKQWPKAFLDEEPSPIDTLAHAFFFLMTDTLLAGKVSAATHAVDAHGKPWKLRCRPQDLKDPFLKEMFLDESRSCLLDAGGAAQIMNLESEAELTSEKVLKTRLATFAKEAGIESEFTAMVHNAVLR